MSNIYKGELQDYLGNTIYPHAEADTIFCADGETVQSKLAKQEAVVGDITGKTGSLEVNDANILATTEATYALNEKVGELNNNLGGLSFYEDSDGNKYVVGADAVPKKLGSMEFLDSYTVTVPNSSQTPYLSIDRNIGLKANGVYLLFCVLVGAATGSSRGRLLFDTVTAEITNGTGKVEKLSPGWFIWKIETTTACTINVRGAVGGASGGIGTFGVCSVVVFG